jgi:DNA-binding transcriptional LysR family regulator
MTVGLRHLRFAVEAAYHGSFRRAADSMRVRQSTLSRTIWQLENALGIALFLRSSGGVRPTLAGVHFVETAGHLLEDFDELLESSKARGLGTVGHLSLGLLTFAAAAPLEPALVGFAKERPEVTLSLLEASKRVLLRRVLDGTLDLAIVAGQIHEESCEILSLWSERILLVLPLSHPLSDRRFATWTDLDGEIVLMSRQGLGPELQELLTTKLAAFGGSARIQCHPASAEALLSLASAGLGLTIQCEGGLQLPQRNVVHREMHDQSGASWMTYAACWKKVPSNPAITPFLAHLRTYRPALSAGHAAVPRPTESAEYGPR